MPKIQQNQKGNLFVYIPKTISRLKGWEKGTELALIATDKGDLLLREIEIKLKYH